MMALPPLPDEDAGDEAWDDWCCTLTVQQAIELRFALRRATERLGGDRL